MKMFYQLSGNVKRSLPSHQMINDSYIFPEVFEVTTIFLCLVLGGVQANSTNKNNGISSVSPHHAQLPEKSVTLGIMSEGYLCQCVIILCEEEKPFSINVLKSNNIAYDYLYNDKDKARGHYLDIVSSFGTCVM